MTLESPRPDPMACPPLTVFPELSHLRGQRAGGAPLAAAWRTETSPGRTDWPALILVPVLVTKWGGAGYCDWQGGQSPKEGSCS